MAPRKLADVPAVSVSSLTARGIARVSTKRPLQLVDLAGPGLAQLGLDARICTIDHALAQQWSKAIWAHPMGVDGIWYIARHDSEQRSIALFDRAAPAITVRRSGGLLDQANALLTASAIDTYGLALLP